MRFFKHLATFAMVCCHFLNSAGLKVGLKAYLGSVCLSIACKTRLELIKRPSSRSDLIKPCSEGTKVLLCCDRAFSVRQQTIAKVAKCLKNLITYIFYGYLYLTSAVCGMLITSL